MYRKGYTYTYNFIISKFGVIASLITLVNMILMCMYVSFGGVTSETKESDRSKC